MTLVTDPILCPSPTCPLHAPAGGTPRYKAVLLFGAPGSGKGTQGRILDNIPGFYHSSTGDIFRSLDLQSEIGRVFWEYAGKGQLVPDEVVIRVWKQFITGMELTNSFFPETQILILDGLPRNVNQARLLEDTIDVWKVIHLQADMNKMVERLRRRALKENRFDDANDAVVRKRLDVYERDTKPMLDYYPDEKIVPIDAMQPQIRVLTQILNTVAPLKEQIDKQAAAMMAQPQVTVQTPPPKVVAVPGAAV